jgi:peptide-methionine (S)-S-oxide reductase
MAASLVGVACSIGRGDLASFPDPVKDLPVAADVTQQQAVLAGGCFWCTEAVFERIPGVVDVESGYAGDTKERATYKLVSAGETNHAEVIRITYDPRQVSYGKLLKVFFAIAHDPTTLNRQGADVGRQYRSAIFYASDAERDVADTYIKQLNAAKSFSNPIVTSLEKLEAYYPAEKYHQDYARINPTQPYVAAVAQPKIEKAEKYGAGLVATTQPGKE